jgi:hypothetical protein
MHLNEDEVKRLREETQASLKAMDSMLLTKTERYVIRYARENGIDNEDVRGCLMELKKAQIIPGDEASKLYAICILERDCLDTM